MNPTITYLTTRLTQLHHNIKDLEDKLALAIEERDSHEAAIKLIEENEKKQEAQVNHGIVG